MDPDFKNILEFLKLSEEYLILCLEEALREYKQYPMGQGNKEAIMFIMVVLQIKLVDMKPEEILEQFQHFKAFHQAIKFTK